MAVAIVFAVRFVVLIIVGDEVVERESVMRGDKIHASPRPAAATVELVRRGAKTGRQSFGWSFSAPEVPYRVAERIVPFRPSRRKSANLVTARSAIPRLGNQLHFGEQRILANGLEKAALRLKTVRLAR